MSSLGSSKSFSSVSDPSYSWPSSSGGTPPDDSSSSSSSSILIAGSSSSNDSNSSDSLSLSGGQSSSSDDSLSDSSSNSSNSGSSSSDGSLSGSQSSASSQSGSSSSGPTANPCGCCIDGTTKGSYNLVFSGFDENHWNWGPEADCVSSPATVVQSADACAFYFSTPCYTGTKIARLWFECDNGFVTIYASTLYSAGGIWEGGALYKKTIASESEKIDCSAIGTLYFDSKIGLEFPGVYDSYCEVT